MSVVCERMDADACRSVAQTHAVSFPGEFLTLLGISFLERYYRWFVSRGAIAWIARDGADIVGFVCGWYPGASPLASMARDLRVPFARGALHGLACSPIAMGRHLWARRALTRTARAAAPPAASTERSERASLESIAVAPASRGTPVARELIRVFIEDARQRGAIRARLTVRADNARARSLYERTGWQLDAVLDEGRGEVAKYVYEIGKGVDP